MLDDEHFPQKAKIVAKDELKNHTSPGSRIIAKEEAEKARTATRKQCLLYPTGQLQHES